MEGGVEGALLHRQHVAREQLDAFRDGPPVERLARERLEDQQIESALKEV
jgi:hypothetical protein